MKILLIEDEEALSAAIAKGLKKIGFAVDQAYDGEEALYLYDINEYDLLVLDLNLPVIDGMEVLSRIRKTDLQTKILILSARSDVADRVSGLNQGANDYLIKPFDFEELTARIHNLLRQTFIQTPSTVSIRHITINLLSKTVKVRELPVALTNKEYALLEYLMLNKDRVVGQAELIEHIWSSEASLFSNSLKFHIYSLKKKLGDENIISNVRGQGYTVKGEHTNE